MLKKVTGFLMFLFLITSLCGQDYSKEEQIIKSTIENETKYFYQSNLEAWSDSWVHSDNAYFSVASPYNHIEKKGWKNISEYLAGTFNNDGAVNISPQKENYNFTINGNMAFVTFEEDGDASTRVLEKVDGKWKMLTMEVFKSKDYTFHNKVLQLNRLTGCWKADTSTAKAPEEWRTKLIHAKMEFSFEDFVLSCKGSYKVRNPWGIWEQKDEIRLTVDTGMRYISSVHNESGPNWAVAFTGFTEIDDEGNLTTKKFRTRDQEHPVQIETITWKTSDRFEIKVSGQTETGEAYNEYSIEFVKQ